MLQSLDDFSLRTLAVVDEWNIEDAQIKYALEASFRMQPDEAMFMKQFLDLTLHERATVLALFEGLIEPD